MRTLVGLVVLLVAGVAHGATYNCVWNGTTGNWSDASRWSSCNGTVPNNGTDNFNVSISTGVVTLPASVTIDSLSFSGGAIDGGNLVATAISWSGGRMAGPGTTTTLLVSTSGSTVYLGRPLVTTPGGASTLSTNMIVESGAELTNNGDLAFSGDIGFIGMPATPPVLHNHGRLLKTGGSAGTNVDFVVDNTGAIEIMTGYLALHRGGTSTGTINGTAVALDGVFTIASVQVAQLQVFTEATTITGTLAVSQYVSIAASGSLTVNTGAVTLPTTIVAGTLAGTAPITVSGALDVTGTLAGSDTITANGGLALSGTPHIQGHVVVPMMLATTLSGEVWIESATLDAIGPVAIAANTTVRATGSANLACTAPITLAPGTTTIEPKLAAGDIVTAMGGTLRLVGDAAISGRVFGNTSNDTIEFVGGTASLGSASWLVVARVVASGGTAHVTGLLTAQEIDITSGALDVSTTDVASVATCLQSGGSLLGTATLHCGNPMRSTGGDQGGTGTTESYSAIAITNPGTTKTLGRTLAVTAPLVIADGQLDMTSTGGLYLKLDTVSNPMGGGSASLDGTLAVELVNNFANTVSHDDVIVVVAAGQAMAGAFSNVASGTRLVTADQSGTFVVSYGPTSGFGSERVVLSSWYPGVTPPPVDAGVADASPPFDDANVIDAAPNDAAIVDAGVGADGGNPAMGGGGGCCGVGARGDVLLPIAVVAIGLRRRRRLAIRSGT